MTQAELDQLTVDQITVLSKTTQKLADEMQRQTAAYQRLADRLRKALKRRGGK